MCVGRKGGGGGMGLGGGRSGGGGVAQNQNKYSFDTVQAGTIPGLGFIDPRWGPLDLEHAQRASVLIQSCLPASSAGLKGPSLKLQCPKSIKQT